MRCVHTVGGPAPLPFSRLKHTEISRTSQLLPVATPTILVCLFARQKRNDCRKLCRTTRCFKSMFVRGLHPPAAIRCACVCPGDDAPPEEPGGPSYFSHGSSHGGVSFLLLLCTFLLSARTPRRSCSVLFTYKMIIVCA